METLFKVGDLAERTGLTVRTLHHYDEIGLLRPHSRTRAGHRLYGRAELERLQQIRSLKQLGLSLEEAAACLDDPGSDLGETLRMHRRRLEEQIDRLRALRDRLRRLESRAGDAGLSADELMSAIRQTALIDRYYAPWQLERLAARRAEVGESAIEAIQERWLDLARRVAALRSEGVEPTEERALELAREWRSLQAETVSGFTGGDAGIERSLARMWGEEPGMGSEWGLGPDVRAYMGRALRALHEAGPDRGGA